MEILLYRILSGIYRFKYKNKSFCLKSISNYHKYISEEIYIKYYNKAKEDGMYTEQQVLSLLISQNLWNSEKEEELNKSKKFLDQLKVELFDNYHKTDSRNINKARIEQVRKKCLELLAAKHQLDHFSCDAYASSVKAKYIVSKCLYRGGIRVFKNRNYLQSQSKILEYAVNQYNAGQITETQYRLLARNESWRNIWKMRDANLPIFSTSADKLTIEQLNLLNWSIFYENILKNEKRPPNYIIEDDDALDGWLIKFHKDSGNNNADKYMDAQELFIPVYQYGDTDQDVNDNFNMIKNLNSPEAKSIKNLRSEAIKKYGTVKEQDLPDQKNVIMKMAQGMRK